MRTLSQGDRPPEGRGAREPAAREAMAAALAMSALAIGMTWPLALHARSALPGDLADPLLNAFTLAWDADRMAHGLRGLWDAPLFFPLRGALAFSDHLLGIALFTSPLQWLTGNAVLSYNVAFIASYALAGFGAYLLARSLWGSRRAAWVAGVAFAAAPHRAMHLSHLQILMSGWLPLGLWGLHEYFASGSRRMLAVFAVSYVLLALSSTYLMFFAAVPIALVGMVALVRPAGRERDAADTPARVSVGARGWRRAATDLGVTAVAIALSLAPIAVAYLRARQVMGLRRTSSEMALFSARALDYLHVPHRLHAWAWMFPAGPGERTLFPGLVVVLLACLALLAAVVRRARRLTPPDARAWLVGLYGLMLGLSTWLTLGPSIVGPYRWLVALVPGFDGLRVPARFVVVVALALAVLAGRGAQQAVEWARLPVRARPWLTSALVAAIALEGFAGPLPLAAFDPTQRQRQSLNAWLEAAPPGGLLELPVAGAGFKPFTTVYQFNTLFHHHPTVNGYTGTGFGLQDFLADAASPLARLVEVPAALEGLRQLGVRYLALHRSSYEQWHQRSARDLIDAIDAEDGQVASRLQFGDTTAWRLADAAPLSCPADTRVIPPAGFLATASTAPQQSGLAFDGSTTTRWTTAAPKRGDEWFQLTFDRERHLACVVFRSGREHRHAERALRLAIESVADDGSSRIVFDGSVVPQVMADIVGQTGGAVVCLAANSTRVLRLRQTGRGGRTPWSIEELEVRERQ